MWGRDRPAQATTHLVRLDCEVLVHKASMCAHTLTSPSLEPIDARREVLIIAEAVAEAVVAARCEDVEVAVVRVP